MSELDRIRWRSRRGLLELDLVLERFLNEHLETLTPEELEIYKDLLFLPDNDFLYLVDGKVDSPDENLMQLIRKMRACWGTKQIASPANKQ